MNESMNQKPEKQLNLTLDEARIIYLSTRKMGETIEKDLIRKKGNETFNQDEELEKLKTIHALSNKMKKFLNDFLVEI
jgi:ribose 5-phosphate isomerase RpiB